MNTMHIIRTELTERGLPLTLVNIVDVVIAQRIDAQEHELQLLRQEVVELKKAIYQLKTKGQSE
jgi:hypothetical protein